MTIICSFGFLLKIQTYVKKGESGAFAHTLLLLFSALYYSTEVFSVFVFIQYPLISIIQSAVIEILPYSRIQRRKSFRFLVGVDKKKYVNPLILFKI
jgi:hypothetical protein